MKPNVKFWRKPLDVKEIRTTRGKVHIIKNRCKGCGFCVEYCPVDALKMSEEFNSKGYHPPCIARETCVNCGFCEMICPDFAIYCVLLEDEGKNEAEDEREVSNGS